MVKAARTPDGPDAFRPLNAPRLVRVETTPKGRPTVLVLGRKRLKVAEVHDAWRVKDEWWRGRSVARTYFDVLLEDGRKMTLFFDAPGDQWYAQRYT